MVFMIKKCKICDKEGPPIYTSMGYKMTPLCLDCYKKIENQRKINIKN